MIGFLKSLFSSWTWKMAYLDSRATKWKLFLFSTSIVFGVAALVVIGSLRSNLNNSVKSQSKSLLGADIQLSARSKFSTEAENLTKTIGGEQAREISLNTMMTVGENQKPRLVNLRGIESGFPFYGDISTTPPNSWNKIQSQDGVLVEDSFLISIKGKIGDLVTFGDQQLPILGVLNEAPPSSSSLTSITPTVVTAIDIIKNSDLITKKSLSLHRTYFKLPNVDNHREWIKPYEDTMDKERLRSITATERSERIESTIDNLYIFLNLIGFSSLFLGGIGIAGAIHMHIAERLQSVATLRCLGCSSSKAFSIYFIQGFCMGLVGTLLGLVVGCGIVILISFLIHSIPNIVPFEITIAPVFSELLKAASIGLIVSLCFALLPLLKVRKISPLAALRQISTTQQKQTWDPLRLLIYLLLFCSAFLLAYIDNRNLDSSLTTAASYVGFLVITFSALLTCGFILRKTLKIVVNHRWPITIRQGFSALYRPNNQTSIFMLSIGLGVFFLFTLIFMQNILLQWLNPERLAQRPNVFMIDIPPEDADKAKKIVKHAGAHPLTDAPIIQLRMLKLKGTPIEDILKQQNKTNASNNVDTDNQIPKWILKHSFRCTTRSELSTTEKIVQGKWIDDYQSNHTSSGLIPISIEEKIAENLQLNIGDTLTMELEGFGETIELEIASLRKVDWQSMNLNFFIVLPKGSVEDYIAFNVITAHSSSPETTAELQQNVFKEWPSVNVVDLSLILRTVQSVLTTAGKAIQGMALFTVITGSIVLISALLSGRKIRAKEVVLLRTLGASQSQIAKILAIEYSLLSLLATIAGAGLATLACYLLGIYIFENETYKFPWQHLFLSSSVVILTTVSLGMFLSRGIAKTPPMLAIKENQ